MAECRVTPPARTRGDIDPPELRVVRFEYLSSQHAPGLVGLSVRTPLAWPWAARPSLLLQRGTYELLYPPRLVSRSRGPGRDSVEWLWRGLFATPPELASDPGWSFHLLVEDDVPFALPTPVDPLARLREPPCRAASRKAWPYAVRRGALLFVVTCQLSLAPAWAAAVAAADTPPSPPTSAEPTGESSQPPPTKPPIEPVQEGVPAAPTGGSSEGATEHAPQLGSEPSSEAPAPPGSALHPEAAAGGPQPSPGSAAPVPTAASSQPSPSEGHGQVGSSWRTRMHAPGHSQGASDHGGRDAHAQHARGGHYLGHGKRRNAAHRRARSHEHPQSEAQAPGLAVVSPGPFEVPPGLLLPVGPEAPGEHDPPAFLIPIYEDAGHRYGVPWRVLAAINEIETDYGRNLSVSPAGAVGWMQFMPETWRQWAVDADGDGQANPYSPMDAIFTAARYLQANGASRDLPGAIFAYNHAAWYVAYVLLRAHALEHDPTAAGSLKGYALPLDKPYMQQLGRTDDGVDIETPPDGALVYSITPGVVSAVASDPEGFGPNYPVIEATAGPLAAQHVYYGHVAQALVQPGQRVAAGQPIAIVGHTGDAASLGHGHIEIGFSDANGDPLSHHGTTASTPAGELMRGMLVELSAELGVHNS
jgi:murein DD-endopeptidase MepM/ murein hydrolase activator NlpD